MQQLYTNAKRSKVNVRPTGYHGKAGKVSLACAMGEEFQHEEKLFYADANISLEEPLALLSKHRFRLGCRVWICQSNAARDSSAYI